MLSRVVLLYQICLEMTINLFFPLNNTGSSISVLLFLLLFQNRTLKCFDYLQCTILHVKITSCQCFKSCPNWRLHTSGRDSYICKEKLLYYCPAQKLRKFPFHLQLWCMLTFQHFRQEGNSRFWTLEIHGGELLSVTALINFIAEIGLEWRF